MIDPNPDIVVGIALVSSVVTLAAVLVSAWGRHAEDRAKRAGSDGADH